MEQNLRNDVECEYALATGTAATHRLRVLHSLYGPGARRVLLRAASSARAGRHPGVRGWRSDVGG
jgi:hypothetical protein